MTTTTKRKNDDSELAVIHGTARVSPLVYEFELSGLLLLHATQQLLEVLALLHDVGVLHLLIFAAVAADQL